MRKLTIVLLLMLSGLLGLYLSLRTFDSKEESLDQFGVTVLQTFHFPATFVKQIENDPNAPQKIFKQFCATCHSNPPVIDVKAPLIGDAKIWSVLSKQGIATLLDITIKGRGAMPARGGCFECSDDQLRQTIEYILKQSISGPIKPDVNQIDSLMSS